MAKKISVSRSFTFKAYRVNDGEISLKNVKNYEFLFKSECHYYAEKFVLDYINDNFESLKNVNGLKFILIKVYDHDLTDFNDFLIEQISVKNDKIHID